MSPSLEDHEDTRGRKRERDKQNQRRKRLRERDAFLAVERRNASLERQVKALRKGTSGDVRQMSDTIHVLQSKLQALQDQLNHADKFVQSWATIRHTKDHLPGSDGNNAAQEQLFAAGHKTSADRDYLLPDARNLFTGDSDPVVSPPVLNPSYQSGGPKTTWSEPTIARQQSHSTQTFSSAGGSSHQGSEAGNVANLSPSASWMATGIDDPVAAFINYRQDAANLVQAHPGPSELTVSTRAFQDLLALPMWQRMPPNFPPVSGCSDVYGITIKHLRSSPEKFALCNPQPKVLDLLLGGSPNELANVIFEMAKNIPCRRPEKLAISWMAYLVVRWRIEPSEENFNRVPPMLRPTTTQLLIPHAEGADYVIWPQMRENFIKHGKKYVDEAISGLLFCTWRIRGTPNVNFIVRGEDGEVEIDPDFLAKISTPEGWVLLERFWIEYPELVEGLDPDRFMISEKDLV